MRAPGGIRGRLWLGVAGLLMVLLTAVVLALAIGLRADAEVERIFRDNGDSLAYMHDFADASARVDAWAQASLRPGRPKDGAGEQAALDAARRDLDAERRNVTEGGEREADARLDAAWAAYTAGLPAVADRGRPAAGRLRLYRSAMAPAYARTRELAWVIAGLNLRNARFRDHGRELLASEFRLMGLLLLLGVAMGAALVVRLGRSLVDPLVEDVAALRRLDEMKTGLLATVSHEIRNPLTSLRMAAHLLAEDEAAGRTGRRGALLAVLKDNVERMHGAIDGLLELGRLQSGDLLRLERARPRDLLTAAADSMRGPLERQGLRLEAFAAGDLPDVRVDEGRLRLVFSNLLDNAARHSPPGAAVTAGAERDPRGVRFWVQDEGPGVPKEYGERVFERFFRAPGQPEGTGLGLGLSIAREIVELHGGELRLDPSERGARFSFLIPSAP